MCTRDRQRAITATEPVRQREQGVVQRDGRSGIRQRCSRWQRVGGRTDEAVGIEQQCPAVQRKRRDEERARRRKMRSAAASLRHAGDGRQRGRQIHRARACKRQRLRATERAGEIQRGEGIRAKGRCAAHRDGTRSRDDAVREVRAADGLQSACGVDAGACEIQRFDERQRVERDSIELQSCAAIGRNTARECGGVLHRRRATGLAERIDLRDLHDALRNRHRARGPRGSIARVQLQRADVVLGQIVGASGKCEGRVQCERATLRHRDGVARSVEAEHAVGGKSARG